MIKIINEVSKDNNNKRSFTSAEMSRWRNTLSARCAKCPGAELSWLPSGRTIYPNPCHPFEISWFLFLLQYFMSI